MPAAKPALTADWATGGVVGVDLVQPANNPYLTGTGWSVQEEPPREYFNWYQNLVGKWTDYLRDAAFFSTVGSNLPGLSATAVDAGQIGGVFQGGAAAPGGDFTAGAGGAHGLTSRGSNLGAGGQFTGGAGGGAGVQGIGGTANGAGGAFTGTAAGPGVDSTGGATGPGGRFTAGGTTAPALVAVGNAAVGSRGAIQIGNSGLITAAGLQPGDFWWDGTNLRFCKVAGAAVVIV